jgi:hypothetical protein
MLKSATSYTRSVPKVCFIVGSDCSSCRRRSSVAPVSRISSDMVVPHWSPAPSQTPQPSITPDAQQSICVSKTPPSCTATLNVLFHSTKHPPLPRHRTEAISGPHGAKHHCPLQNLFIAAHLAACVCDVKANSSSTTSTTEVQEAIAAAFTIRVDNGCAAPCLQAALAILVEHPSLAAFAYAVLDARCAGRNVHRTGGAAPWSHTLAAIIFARSLSIAIFVQALILTEATRIAALSGFWHNRGAQLANICICYCCTSFNLPAKRVRHLIFLKPSVT